MRYSMPVGRIEYLHLGPMQFEEFLLASGEDRLVSFLKTFLVTGGMPEAVDAYLATKSPRESERIKHFITSAFKDDFSKYGRRVKHSRLSNVFTKVPAMVGRKFKYVNVDRGERSGAVADALDLLCMANLAFRVRHTSANGVPLGAEASGKVFKVLFLDVGLMSTMLGLTLLDYEKAEDVLLVNNGAVCEQAVGQHLLGSLPYFQEPDLYYWAREKQNSMAEVDYLISEGQNVIPVEVKTGKTGTLKSMHSFLREKNRAFGMRFNTGLPSLLNAKTSLPDGKDIPFQLLSLPIYMAGQARRLVRAALRQPE